MAQYDSISKKYTDFAKIDPIKVYAQYPEAIRLLGSIKNKKVLDVGCGSGTLTAQLSKKGASVVGYDISSGQIDLAKSKEKESKLGIQYFVSDPTKIEKTLVKRFGKLLLFDKASSTLVLHYAKNREHLFAFFSSTYNLLKNNGIFSAIFTNPDYKRTGKSAAYNRFFERENGRLRVDFLKPNGDVKMSAYFSDLSRKDYEYAIKKAGFKSFKWIKLKISKEGVEKMGKEFWKDYERDCPYIGLKAMKN